MRNIAREVGSLTDLIGRQYKITSGQVDQLRDDILFCIDRLGPNSRTEWAISVDKILRGEDNVS